MKGLSGNVGICSEQPDCHYTDCIVVDYTTGIKDTGGSSRFTRCHVWGGTVAPESMDMKEWSSIYGERKQLFASGIYGAEGE